MIFLGNEYAWIVWLVLAVFLALVESVTYNLVSVWFAAGALVAVIPALIAPDVIWLQLAVFLTVSALLLAFTRKFVKNILHLRPQKTNADQVIGKTALVKETIDNTRETGRVSVLGLDWSARCVNNTVIPAGETVTVKAISGVKLIVEK